VEIAVNQRLGIDVGGSGMKGAIVDTDTGTLITGRVRFHTPDPATPAAMARVFADIVRHFDWKGPVGCGMPGPIKGGAVMTANNLDKSWLGVRAHEVYAEACGCAVTVINDADAAGLAEMRFGAGRGVKGVVVLITLGTGIGSALFVDGKLLPNTELGQLELRGKNAERRASDRVRTVKGLTWKRYARAVAEYIETLENLIWPDLIIVGGGISKKAHKLLPRISSRAPLVPAQLQNEAGIIGAALCVMNT
jgi:polyphosphate glucokinase